MEGFKPPKTVLKRAEFSIRVDELNLQKFANIFTKSFATVRRSYTLVQKRLHKRDT